MTPEQCGASRTHVGRNAISEHDACRQTFQTLSGGVQGCPVHGIRTAWVPFLQGSTLLQVTA